MNNRPTQDASNNALLRREVRAAILKADKAIKAARSAVADAHGLTTIYWAERGEAPMPPASWLAQHLLNSLDLASGASHTLVTTMHARLPPFPPPSRKRKP